AGNAAETSFWMKKCWLRKARRILTATPSLRGKTSSLTFFVMIKRTAGMLQRSSSATATVIEVRTAVSTPVNTERAEFLRDFAVAMILILEKNFSALAT